MIHELREAGRVNGAPILVIRLELANKDWVALAYKNNIDVLSICFWSARDQSRVATAEFMDSVASEADAHQDDGPGSAGLFDIRYKQPLGWDRWLGGIPRPVRSYFDETLHTRLKALLDVER